MDKITTIIEEMDSRFNNIKIYLPFFDVYLGSNKYNYNLPVIMLSILSYLVNESKLKHKKITFRDIQGFVSKLLIEIYVETLFEQELKEFVSYTLDKMQNGGSFNFRYYSPIAKKEKEKLVKLIDIKPEKNEVYYYITDEGLDFYLKTKEFPEESKITINLLLFQKQIENGSYGYALDTVRNLRMEVEKRIEEKRTILERLMFGGKEGMNNYNEYHRKVELQFKKEKELFHEVLVLLEKDREEFIDKIEKNVLSKKEKKANEQLNLISKEMNISMENHNKLLKEVVDLIKKYDEIMKMKQKNAFSEKFKFNEELEKMVEKKISLEKASVLLEPLLMPKLKKSFNPLNFFKSQKITSNKATLDYEDLDKTTENKKKKTLDEEVKERANHNFNFFMRELLHCVKKSEIVTLEEWISYLEEKYGKNISYNADLVSFLIKINHKKDENFKKETIIYDFFAIKDNKQKKNNTEIDYLLKDILLVEPLTNLKQLEITTIPQEDIAINEVVKVTNMIFKGE